jgi:hypothetical protein
MFRPSLALALALLLAAAQAAAQEREWVFDTGEEDAFLVFGVPQTDDAGVSFWCPMGSGKIHIFISEMGGAVRADGPAHIDVIVTGRTFGYGGKSQVNEESGAPSIEAVTDSTDELFVVLQSADRFTVKMPAAEEIYPLAGADFSSLLRACGKS